MQIIHFKNVSETKYEFEIYAAGGDVYTLPLAHSGWVWAAKMALMSQWTEGSAEGIWVIKSRQKKKDFILKTGLCFFFPFCIQYIVIQTSQYYIQIHNILKKPISDEHFKRTLFCNAPVGREKVRDLPPQQQVRLWGGIC